MKPRRETPAKRTAQADAPHAAAAHSRVQQPGSQPWPARLNGLLAVFAIGLAVAAAIVPSEGSIREGTYAGLATGWCLLCLLWAALALHSPGTKMRLGWTEIAGGAFVAWHSLAGLAWLGRGNDRQTLNALWLMISYGLTVLLLRQVVTSGRRARMLVALMVWLATTLASVGYVQYFVTMPALRAHYASDPQRVLAEHGISAHPDAAQRLLFENRLQSVEPLATFALTNSLAGLLAPWLIAALGIGVASLREARLRRALVGAALIAALIAGCLLLTKSRTAVLAVLTGLVLLALYGRRSGWSIGWRIPAAAAGIIVVIGLGAIYVGGLDAEVLSEAPKSVLYRLEYWRGTAAMIADQPLWGCGPGNFQETYAAYKLPQASEMVADPHNFLLEIWATVGTPGIVLLLATIAALAIDLTRLAAGGCGSASASPVDPAAHLPQDALLFHGGGISGLVVGALLALMAGYPLDTLADMPVPVVWWVGLPLLALVWWLMRPWIEAGELPVGTAIVGALVLLINLLAAGAVVFPGVMVTLLVLVPIALQLAPRGYAAGDQTAADRRPWWIRLPIDLRLSRWAAGLLCFGALAVALSCIWTEYQPVLTSGPEMQIALKELQQGDAAGAQQAALAAARSDPWNSEPKRLLAELQWRAFINDPTSGNWQALVAAAEEFRRSNPRYHGQAFQRGNWYFLAWQRAPQDQSLALALDAYREALDHYPNHALYHGQLAWALHQAGQDSESRQAADRAQELDDAMPHADQKLARQRIADLQMSPGARRVRPETAEQTVENLRTTPRR